MKTVIVVSFLAASVAVGVSSFADSVNFDQGIDAKVALGAAKESALQVPKPAKSAVERFKASTCGQYGLKVTISHVSDGTSTGTLFGRKSLRIKSDEAAAVAFTTDTSGGIFWKTIVRSYLILSLQSKDGGDVLTLQMFDGSKFDGSRIQPAEIRIDHNTLSQEKLIIVGPSEDRGEFYFRLKLSL